MTNGRGMTRSTIISPRASSYLEACESEMDRRRAVFWMQ